MPVKYLSNAFSLSMLTVPSATLRVERVTREVFCSEAKEAVSAVGHPATAQVISQICGFPIQANRVTITMKPGDVLLVFQIMERLPEGKVLSKEEVESLVAQGKVEFRRVEYIEEALEERSITINLPQA